MDAQDLALTWSPDDECFVLRLDDGTEVLCLPVPIVQSPLPLAEEKFESSCLPIFVFWLLKHDLFVMAFVSYGVGLLAGWLIWG